MFWAIISFSTFAPSSLKPMTTTASAPLPTIFATSPWKSDELGSYASLATTVAPPGVRAAFNAEPNPGPSESSRVSLATFLLLSLCIRWPLQLVGRRGPEEEASGGPAGLGESGRSGRSRARDHTVGLDLVDDPGRGRGTGRAEDRIDLVARHERVERRGGDVRTRAVVR